MVKCKLVKRSKTMQAAPKKMMAVGDPAPDYVLTDNEDGTITVSGVNKAGDELDISSVATLTAESNDPTLAQTSVSGMVVSVSALKVGTPTVTITATWNDGSIGPFVIDVPLLISTDPNVTGLKTTFGVPTVRP